MGFYILSLILFCVGLYAVLIKKNVVKIIIGIMIMEYSVNLLFVLVGYKNFAEIPLLKHAGELTKFVDPLPQAAILILLLLNLSVTVVAAAIAIRIYEKYGTFDITKVRRLKG